jgi:hypothetical protein
MLGRSIAALALLIAASQGAAAGDKPPHHFSCAVIRLYVAKYTAPAAEAWARNNGATDAEIESARRCLGSNSGVQTASWTSAASMAK